MPASLQKAVDAIPREIVPENYTTEQRGLVDAFNDGVARGERWRKICT